MRRILLTLLGSLLLAPSALHAQVSTSTAAAAELTKLLDEQKLDSFAARHGADQFVSVLYFSGSQMLVVGAKYSTPDHITYLILNKRYKDAYADLSSASEQSSKLFVVDLGANGLQFRREKNNNLDTADIAGRSVTFNGEWGGRAKITEADYRKAFETTDAQYAQMLQALITALKKPL